MQSACEPMSSLDGPNAGCGYDLVEDRLHDGCNIIDRATVPVFEPAQHVPHLRARPPAVDVIPNPGDVLCRRLRCSVEHAHTTEGLEEFDSGVAQLPMVRVPIDDRRYIHGNRLEKGRCVIG